MTRTGFDPQDHGFAFVNRWEFDDAERERLHETFAKYLKWSVIVGAATFGLPGMLVAVFGIRALRRTMESHLAPTFGLCGGMCFAALDFYHKHQAGYPSLRVQYPGGRPDTGEELWKVRHRGWSVAPRPVYGHGLVFAIVDRDHPELSAIRPDGSGDVTDSHVVWKATRTMPPRSSPLLVDDLLFLVNRQGVACCLEAETGEMVWRERLKGNFSASPIYADDRIYFFNEKAVCTVIKPSRQFEVLAVNRLAEEQLLASPAVGGQSLFIRTEKQLYRVEHSPGSSQAMNDQRESQDEQGRRFFVGQWSIGASAPQGEPRFVITLNDDFTATKSHVPTATGEWQFVAGEARVTWSDGWKDVLRREGEKYRKVAYRPGTDFDSPPDNTESAEKIGG